MSSIRRKPWPIHADSERVEVIALSMRVHEELVRAQYDIIHNEDVDCILANLEDQKTRLREIITILRTVAKS